MANRQEVTPRPSFPPPLERGSRVWTDRGYLQHGPVDGPKQDILGPQGGEVIGTEKPYYTYDHLLWGTLLPTLTYSDPLMRDVLRDVAHLRKLFPLTGTSERRAGPCRQCHRRTLPRCEGASRPSDGGFTSWLQIYAGWSPTGLRH